MSSNSKGSYYVTDERNMKAYDKLPPSARRALQEAAFDWACPPIVTRWTKGAKGYKTGADIAASVIAWDHQAHTKDARRGVVAPRDPGEGSVRLLPNAS